MNTELIETFVGKYVYVGCGNYAYAGTLAQVAGDFIALSDTTVVYETGPWSSQSWLTEEKLPTTQNVVLNAGNIEMMFAVER